MTLEELVIELKHIAINSTGDRETDHETADNLLLQYIANRDVREAFDNIPKWYA